MTIRRLIWRTLAFHRRSNFAVVLGVAVSAAVITGALLVGDSLRGSLRDRALSRIGWVQEALVAPRFFRQPSPSDLRGGHAEKAITLRATAEHVLSKGNLRRLSNATVWAAQSDLATVRVNPAVRNQIRMPRVIGALFTIGQSLTKWTQPFPQRIEPGTVWLSANDANVLHADVGDTIELRVTKVSQIPRESLLGRRNVDDTSTRIEAKVAGILSARDPVADFSLTPGTAEPHNLFVNLAWLQEKLGLGYRINVLLCADDWSTSPQSVFQSFLSLDDWGLIVRTPESRTAALLAALDRNKDSTLQPNEWRGHIAQADAEAIDSDHDRTLTGGELLAYYRSRGYVSLESQQMLLDPQAERAALAAAKEVGLTASPTLIYLANSINDGKATIPYSLIAALDPAALPTPTGAPAWSLKDDEILLADWNESPLKAKPGDRITMTYFEPELEGRIKESSATFTLRGIVPMRGLAADPDLAPEFPGITDKLDIKDWDPPFPYDNSRLQRRDDEYWARYRTTPKAYITLAAGQKLFGSRFGEATSIRLSQMGTFPDDPTVKKFEAALLAKLDPAAGGFVFDNVRERALAASSGSQDFGGLFLGFSFFLIAAALVLVGLLMRLNLERRAGEIGLLLAAGYSVRTVRRLLLREGFVLAIAGALLGLALAIGYTALMLRLLAALWPDSSVGSFLKLHISVMSVLIGVVGSLVAVWLTLWWSLRMLRRVSPNLLLAGVVSPPTEGIVRRSRKAISVAVGCAILGVALVIGGLFAHEAEARAGTFFSGGALLLIAFLTAGWAWLRRPEQGRIHPGGAAIARLGMRNTLRHPTRSLATASLLASAAFLLMAVESFRRSPEADFLSRTGGSGGYPLIAQVDLPLYQDPSGPEGRQELLDSLEKRWLARGQTPEHVRSELQAARKTLDAATMIPLRRQAGDDVSCLNLYQPGRPRIVGVPERLVERGGFHFAASEDSQDNPWRLLDTPRDDGTIPAVAEKNTVEWILKSHLGGTIPVRDDAGREVQLRIVGLLQDSVFQGELLIGDAAFRRLFPRQEGFAEFLVDPAGHEDAVSNVLTTAFADRGMSIVPAKAKLQGYLQVENTYLSTFQILGGFGLLLGTLGLAVVLLRNVWERRGELALLRAVGFRRRELGGLVFAENVVLVLFGIGAGVLAALIAVVPQWLSGGFATPWLRLLVMLALVVVAALIAGTLAIRATARVAIVPALRNE